MITLLPEQDRSRAHIEYRLRLVSVAAVLLGGVLLFGAAALVPSYVAARVAALSAEEEAGIAAAAADSAALQDAARSLSVSNALLSAISLQSGMRRPSEAFGSVLAARSVGISITRMEYEVSGANTLALRLSGIAATREALLAFRQSVQHLSGVTAADIPIDNLTKAQNVPFVLSIAMQSQP